MATTHGIKLDEETVLRLKVLGEARDRSTHWLMRAAIEAYLEREERYEREKQEDMQRFEHYQLTGNAIAHSEVSQWLTALADGKDMSCPK